MCFWLLSLKPEVKESKETKGDERLILVVSKEREEAEREKRDPKLLLERVVQVCSTTPC
jgi:hypothetical protein